MKQNTQKPYFYKKLRFLSGLVIIALFLSVALQFSLTLASFGDVENSHSNFDAIKYLKDENILHGYPDGSFKPGSNINRAEFTKIIINAVSTEEDRAPFADENCFKDVPGGEWFTEFICYAKSKDIVVGYKDGTFKPADNINFAEASKIITKGFGYSHLNEQGDKWYENYVKQLEVLKSIPENIGSFHKKINRAQMAEIIYRIRAKVIDKPTLTYKKLREKTETAGLLAGELPKFATCDDLRSAIEEKTPEQKYLMEEQDAAPMMGKNKGMRDLETTGAAADDDDSSAGAEEYSETNIQVKGVDEADIIKNDGKYIYLIKGNEIRIVRAYPPENMLEVTRLKMEDPKFSPTEMYVNGDQLIVIGRTYEEHRPYKSEPGISIVPHYPYWGTSKTALYIFDITDKKNPEEKRRVKFDGDYTSSRRVNDTLYMVLNKYPGFYGLRDAEILDENALVPRIQDSSEGEEYTPACGCSDVVYFPDFRTVHYLMVTAIPLDDPKGKISKEVIMGSSENIYSSPENLYIAETDYRYHYDLDDRDYEEKTTVYKWSLNRSDIKFKGQGNVPGRILNQFSMDEYDSHFRIATTKGNVWNVNKLSSNNLYVLDPELKIVGKIEDIAPGERIYSVRFMGKKAYIVTFRKIDPLFVLDVSDHTNPRILGKLKIPGYSDYLHPYDENHIIGFGKNTMEAEEELKEERNLDFVWHQGIKIALFDVSDVESPKELYKEIVGDRGTDSELLRNHKALLFDRNKNLFAFPVTVYEIKDKNANANSYGEAVFQGAYVYTLDLENGFQLRGKITHHDDDEAFKKSGYYFHGGENAIQRIIYIGEYLYTISQRLVKASTMEAVEDVNTVELAKEGYYDEEIK